MNVGFSNDLMATTITPDRSRPPPPNTGGGGGEGPPSHSQAIESLGSTLSSDVRDSMQIAVKELAATGASSEEIRSFVNSELESNGVDIPEGQPRSGQFIDIMS